MDLVKKYGANSLLFLIALIGLIKGCIISGAVLLVLAILSLPIPQMQTMVEKFLEDSFKPVAEKQPNLTLEQFKKSQKNLFIIFCVIFSLFIIFNENEDSNTSVQQATSVQQTAPEYKINIASEIKINPATACDYLKTQNFVTDGYKSDGMGGYFCATPYKMLDGKSNLAYYVEGAQNDVEKLYLVLNVYNGTNKVMLHEQLANNAKVLAKQALNYDLTVDNINAIKNGINTNFKVNNWNIEVFNENWVTGLGSETHFIIKKG